MVMTRAFHAGSTGSNPVRGTTDSHVDSTAFRGERHGGSAHASPTLSTRQALRGLLAVALIFLISAAINPGKATASPLGWQPAQASYYTLFGNRTSCGKTASPTAWFVASLKPDTANCGRKVTICRGHRCVRVTVQDRGAWRSDNRRFDLQPRVRDALHCSDLCNVRWHKGWH